MKDNISDRLCTKYHHKLLRKGFTIRILLKGNNEK